MERADLLTLKQTEQNLIKSDDKERLDVVRELISKFEAPSSEVKQKKVAKNGSN